MCSNYATVLGKLGLREGGVSPRGYIGWRIQSPQMASKQPVFLGNYVKGNEAGTQTETIEVVINVSADLWVALGSPAFDPLLLEGKEQENNNGKFTYGNRGTYNGKTTTLFTDGTTPSGGAKTYQIQVPEFFPLYLIDKFMQELTSPVETFTHIKFRGGRKTAVGTAFKPPAP